MDFDWKIICRGVGLGRGKQHGLVFGGSMEF